MRRARAIAKRAFFELTSRIDHPVARAWLPHYPYMFTPRQLAFLVECLDATRNVPGSIVEVGCMRGRTTVYLCRHLRDVDAIRPYYCIDTFSGFTAADVNHEVQHRGKEDTALRHAFTTNAQRWFDAAMRRSNLTNVTSIAGDVANVDLDDVTRDGVAFALVDVDLYRPVIAALRRLLPHVNPGGVVVVDDCAEGIFDGAAQAYREVMADRGEPEELVAEKLGVIRIKR